MATSKRHANSESEIALGFKMRWLLFFPVVPILIESNDQYLCIVPKQWEASDSPVLLPFEGD